MIHPPPAAFEIATVLSRTRPDTGPSAPVRVLAWTLAALIVAGLHAGLYRASRCWDAADPPPPLMSLAAVMIDLAPIPVAARSDVDNQADGPPSTASEAATAPEPPPAETVLPVVPTLPEVPAQAVLAASPPKPEVKTSETEKTELLARPVKAPRAHRKPDPAKKPRDEDRVAARNGGGPRSDRPTADRAAAPMAGDTISADARAAWQSEVRSRIVRNKRFPSEAHGATGVATVSVTFTASGGVGHIRLLASSGNGALDAEAMAVMARAAPYPPPPGGRAIALSVPLNFRR